MLIPSLRKNLTNRQPSLSRRVNANSQLKRYCVDTGMTSLSRRVNANSQHTQSNTNALTKLIKKGEC